ncbi:MAG: hypothetical protein ACI4LX_09795 [Treponema sp.]
MEKRKARVLIVFIMSLFNFSLCFAHEKIDTMCGIWVHVYGDNSYESLSIEKISFSEYLISYTCSFDHIHDMLEKFIMVSKNLLYIRRDNEEEFFVYLDYDRDSVYFLWNHAFPDSVYYDTELKRGSEVFNDELNQKKQKEYEDKLKQSILESIKQEIKNKKEE